MAKIASLILGVGFGDSGKGITTDYLCSQKKGGSSIVVRFSGGQQAGHNVVIGDISHVHSSFGSGTLRGVPSYFSEHCTISPINMMIEQEVLSDKGIEPKLYIHPLAMITTPADIAYNRIMDKKNGHGTCGLGVGATMDRNLNTGYKLYAIDLLHPEFLNIKLNNIYAYYRNKLNGNAEYTKIYNNQVKFFDEALKTLRFNIQPYDLLNHHTNIIFEGSQGILLDMDHGIFPNVTYGNTTSKNALEICKKIGITEENTYIYYVTRCYQTRHGIGWMSNNDKVKLINTEHEINVFNEWQKDFKIGEIDYDLINHAIRIDNLYSPDIHKSLVVTCLDQRPDFEFDYKKIRGVQGFYESYSPDAIGIKNMSFNRFSEIFHE
jgi:adenylosuccinate synthase